MTIRAQYGGVAVLPNKMTGEWAVPIPMHVFYDEVLLRHPITNHHVCPPSVDMFVDMK